MILERGKMEGGLAAQRRSVSYAGCEARRKHPSRRLPWPKSPRTPFALHASPNVPGRAPLRIPQFGEGCYYETQPYDIGWSQQIKSLYSSGGTLTFPYEGVATRGAFLGVCEVVRSVSLGAELFVL
ncbi:hypothetical protein, unlikely [Trypanosoma congolense IL3000]|uniref:Uncharacterized protein n=1 Tax=Trypanosoma congolense (strain IL3000) TaxID=1068625 RepID=F9WCC9_TRYCI|nr:hypothetical protein, unlikely [Trypanosoma congolense IL3000]